MHQGRDAAPQDRKIRVKNGPTLQGQVEKKERYPPFPGVLEVSLLSLISPCAASILFLLR